MSPRVDRLELGAMEVSIKPRDHGNPHVHAWHNGRKVKIYITTLEAEKSGFPPKQLSILKQ
jgi:hypothetical protein